MRILLFFLCFFYFLNISSYSKAKTISSIDVRLGQLERKNKLPKPIQKFSFSQEAIYTSLNKLSEDNLPLPNENIIKQNRHKFIKKSSSSLADKSLKKLKTGLDALYKNDLKKAMVIRDQLEKDSLDQDILTWSIALSNSAKLSVLEYDQALRDLKNWPEKSKILRNREKSFLSEKRNKVEILDFFKDQDPLTTQGMIAFQKALLHTSSQEKTRARIRSLWINSHFLPFEENQFLKAFSPLLSKSDHFERLESLLFKRSFSEAARTARRIKCFNFYKIIKDALSHTSQKNLSKLNQLEKKWGGTPIFQFTKINLLRRLEKYTRASDLMQKASNIKNLIQNDSWCAERRVLSREMLDLGKADIAYNLVCNCEAINPSLSTDLEFHAGWYALRYLNNPQKALPHFEKIIALSTGNISKSRGYYWAARAHEALRDFPKAKKYFLQAAHYGMQFYGQLAAERLGREIPEIITLQPKKEDFEVFYKLKPVQAIKRLKAIGYFNKSILLYKQLANDLENPIQIALLIQLAQKEKDYFLGLRIAKNAISRNIDIGLLSHPLGAIPLSKNYEPKDIALLYAIARQESEFNPRAQSLAGARGMLQVMPNTGKKIAHKNHIPYSKRKLINDPSYNALLGFYFLQEQLDFFDRSFLVTFAAYNAGSVRVRDWIKRYGDPRLKTLDEIIDWIERIPYPETRNYVMRIMENYEIYKFQLTGKMNIVKDLSFSKIENR